MIGCVHFKQIDDSRALRFRVEDVTYFTLTIAFKVEEKDVTDVEVIYDNSNSLKLSEDVERKLIDKIKKEYPNGFRAY